MECKSIKTILQELLLSAAIKDAINVTLSHNLSSPEW